MNSLSFFPPLPDDLIGSRFLESLKGPLERDGRLDKSDKAWGDFVVEPSLKDYIDALPNVREAAVLFALIKRPEGLSLILVKRSDRLRTHPGQIGLPGGKVEANESKYEAAVREAYEEIGLTSDLITPIGALPSYATGSAYKIHPFLVMVDEAASLVADGQEIDKVFTVPLAHLFNPSNHEIKVRDRQGMKWRYHLIPNDPDPIWGITAGIIHMVYESFYVR